jgi:hypothetical protein
MGKKTVCVLIVCLFLSACSRLRQDGPLGPAPSRGHLAPKDEQILKMDQELQRLRALLSEKEALIRAKDAKIEELKERLRSFGVF